MPFQRLLTNQRSILLAVCLGVLVLRQTESLALLGHWWNCSPMGMKSKSISRTSTKLQFLSQECLLEIVIALRTYVHDTNRRLTNNTQNLMLLYILFKLKLFTNCHLVDTIISSLSTLNCIWEIYTLTDSNNNWMLMFHTPLTLVSTDFVEDGLRLFTSVQASGSRLLVSTTKINKFPSFNKKKTYLQILK